jgi:F0F1-type ATP synthase membrane subunit c/vacuolar-type H+-ATPase subunit K
MSLGLNGSNQNRADGRLRVLRIIWLMILASLTTLFVITRLVEPPVAAAEGSKMLFWMLWGLGFATFGASFVMRFRLLKQAAAKQKPEMVQSAYIIAFALCEATGIFGLLAYFITGIQYYYLFFVLSGFGILLHKPQRDELLAAYREDGF